MRVLRYHSSPAEFRPYDPAVTEVARLLRDLIEGVESKLQVEHVGSTSVPGCAVKGIIDLAVLYPDGFLVRARGPGRTWVSETGRPGAVPGRSADACGMRRAGRLSISDSRPCRVFGFRGA